MENTLEAEGFEPDEFSAEGDKAPPKSSQVSTALHETSLSMPVLTRDTTWNFVDLERNVKRPPVYMVENGNANFKK